MASTETTIADVACELPTAITVPAGNWFLAGDDRGASDDSRFWGPVPTDAITGIVKYRYSAAEASRASLASRSTGERTTLDSAVALLHSALNLC